MVVRGFLSFSAMAAMAVAEALPAGTLLTVRLNGSVSDRSRPGSAVEAVVVAPVSTGGRELVPAGATVRGVVADAQRKAKSDHQALLELTFQRLVANGATIPIEARVQDVDNARETVDDGGIIHGMNVYHVRPTKTEDLLLLAAHAHPIALASFETAKLAMRVAEKPGIRYRQGVEMTLLLANPVELAPGDRQPDRVRELAPSRELEILVHAQPLRTFALRPPAPSDMINLLFAGTERALREVFTAAGWTSAAATTLRTEAATFFAIAGRHSYQHAPVSVLLLDSQEPAFVFQKQNNTFAKRHHIRIWRRPHTFQNRPVWVAAATHDIGIVFSREARTFTHKVGSRVDLERSKVVNDLCFTGEVEAKALVPRPAAPTSFGNATGDKLVTDGRMAVLILTDKT